ncbi:MAG TPA: alpha/beta hydrolase [Anaeromyxobacteraceae bacterium]|nr:alpha/beta hydrolase [Anaeromyxobacteraceae bacterium]
MVLAGQWLERPALVDAGDATLDGLHHRGVKRPALLVCPAPGPGGGMDAPPLAEIAWAAARAGHPSLRFQHRGTGASTGAADAARALDDALAAYRHLAETDGPRLAVAALGAGSAAALGVARVHRHVERVVLVAPGEPPDLEGVAARVLVILPEHGAGVDAQQLSVRLGAAGRVEVVAGADALFRAGLPEVGRRAVAWIAG